MKPAIVQASAGSTGWPLAQGLAGGAAAAPGEPEQPGQTAGTTGAGRRQLPRARKVEAGVDRESRGAPVRAR